MNEFSKKYRIVKILGSQKNRKFGSVFLIQNIDNKQNYILKKAQKSKCNQHLIEQLRKEYSFHFDSKFLPKSIDFYENNDEINIIKSYANGIPLDEYWKKIKRKDYLFQLKRVLKSLELPLNELKDKGIVHCDLKPSNIIIEEVNETLFSHIIDFGLAINQSVIDNRKTLFPLGFAAPELILNKLDCVNHTSDLYSLGLIIWKLYTGKIALSHPNPSVMTNLHITYPIQNESNIPNELFEIISKMCFKHTFLLSPNKYKSDELKDFLNKASQNRFQTIEEINSEINLIENKKRFWDQLLVKFFSKTNVK